MAIATRFLLGALNGLLGPIKAYAIEVCRPEHEALALSLVSTAWGIGLIIGPAIGGYLSQPAEKFPNVFSPDSLFARYSFLCANAQQNVFYDSSTEYLLLLENFQVPIFLTLLVHISLCCCCSHRLHMDASKSDSIIASFTKYAISVICHIFSCI
jgi:MFS family permease